MAHAFLVSSCCHKLLRVPVWGACCPGAARAHLKVLYLQNVRLSVWIFCRSHCRIFLATECEAFVRWEVRCGVFVCILCMDVLWHLHMPSPCAVLEPVLIDTAGPAQWAAPTAAAADLWCC